MGAAAGAVHRMRKRPAPALTKPRQGPGWGCRCGTCVVLAPPSIWGSSGSPAALVAARRCRWGRQTCAAAKLSGIHAVQPEVPFYPRAWVASTCRRQLGQRCSQQRCDLVHRLHGAQLAGPPRRWQRVRYPGRSSSAQLSSGSTRAVPADGQQIDLAAALLQGGQCCRRPLECSSGVEMICRPTCRAARAVPFKARLLASVAPDV